MKANYRTANNRLTFEVLGETPKEVFAQLASIQDVFDAENVCGACNGTDIRYQHRVVDDYQFYELVCKNPECRARFSFGQHKKGGGLFPKRKNDDGHFLPNRGWERYNPENKGQGSGRADDSGNPPQQRSRGAQEVERKNGCAVFPTWPAAEASEAWGERWLCVADVLYKMDDTGRYNVYVKPTAPAPAKA